MRRAKESREDILEQKLACDLRARSRRGQGFYACACTFYGGYTVMLARLARRRVEIRDKLVCRLTAMPGQQCGGNEMGGR